MVVNHTWKPTYKRNFYIRKIGKLHITSGPSPFKARMSLWFSIDVRSGMPALIVIGAQCRARTITVKIPPNMHTKARWFLYAIGGDRQGNLCWIFIIMEFL